MVTPPFRYFSCSLKSEILYTLSIKDRLGIREVSNRSGCSVVKKHLAFLFKAGLIIKEKCAKSSPGRKAYLYSLNLNNDRALIIKKMFQELHHIYEMKGGKYGLE